VRSKKRYTFLFWHFPGGRETSIRCDMPRSAKINKNWDKARRKADKQLKIDWPSFRWQRKNRLTSSEKNQTKSSSSSASTSETLAWASPSFSPSSSASSFPCSSPSSSATTAQKQGTHLGLCLHKSNLCSHSGHSRLLVQCSQWKIPVLPRCREFPRNLLM